MLFAPLDSRTLVGLERKSGDYVLLESLDHRSADNRSFLFTDAERVIRCDRLQDVGEALAEVDEALRCGCWIAGFLSYEAGYAFEDIGGAPLPPGPLLWFGVYRSPRRLDGAARRRLQNYGRQEERPDASFLPDAALHIGSERYRSDIAHIKDYIAAGDAFQINYTARMRFDFAASCAMLYDRLRRTQPVPYAAMLRCEDLNILSFSPELFFRLENGRITCRPMKGTAPRGVSASRDREIAAWLSADAKNRAENVMIVDLMRNDLGRICRPGSVRVPALFTAERYATLWQMTSTVEGELYRGCPLSEVLRALFPCGSVTGAPKVRSMEIIAELEREPRGVYTGAIGWMGPEGRGAFSVAIRTLSLREGRGEMGLGGGIVWDSDPLAEYEEALLKGHFLTTAIPDFKLLETMLWKADSGFYLLKEHLQRLEETAGYFDYPFDRIRIEGKLRDTAGDFGGQVYRVRLLLGKDGLPHTEAAILPLQEDNGRDRKLLLSESRVDYHDPFLQHKTTHRAFFDEELKRCRRQGYYEVIFANQDGELTQGAASNLFLRLEGVWYTPPLHCGLLPGVMRRRLLEEGRARERVLYAGDLLRAESIAAVNSVRGCVKVSYQRLQGLSSGYRM